MKFSSVIGDLFGGVLVLCIGVFFLYHSGTYQTGELTRMGPGYFPKVIAIVTIGIGVLVTGFALGEMQGRLRDQGELAVDLFPLAMVSAGVILFGVLVEHLGLIPSAFIAAMAASLGRGEGHLPVQVLSALAITAAIVVLNYFIFNVPVPLVRTDF